MLGVIGSALGDSGSALRVVGLALGGSGSVLRVVGPALGVVAQSAEGRFSAGCVCVLVLRL